MAVLIIPTRTDLANYDQTVELDGVEFVFEFRFNARDDAWYFNVLNTSGDRLRSGIKVMSNWALLQLWKDDTRPGGEIIAFDNREVAAPAGIFDLGSDVLLTYVEAETLEGISVG